MSGIALIHAEMIASRGLRAAIEQADYELVPECVWWDLESDERAIGDLIAGWKHQGSAGL
jgi:hypothetical protein